MTQSWFTESVNQKQRFNLIRFLLTCQANSVHLCSRSIPSSPTLRSRWRWQKTTRSWVTSARPMLTTSEFCLAGEAESYWADDQWIRRIVLDFWAVIWAASSIHYKGCIRTHPQQHTLIDVIVVGLGPLMHPARVLRSWPLEFHSKPIYGNKKRKTSAANWLKKQISILTGKLSSRSDSLMSRDKMCWPLNMAI